MIGCTVTLSRVRVQTSRFLNSTTSASARLTIFSLSALKIANAGAKSSITYMRIASKARSVYIICHIFIILQDGSFRVRLSFVPLCSYHVTDKGGIQP